MVHHVVSHYNTQPSCRVCLIHHMTCLHLSLIINQNFVVSWYPVSLLHKIICCHLVTALAAPQNSLTFHIEHCAIHKCILDISVADVRIFSVSFYCLLMIFIKHILSSHNSVYNCSLSILKYCFLKYFIFEIFNFDHILSSLPPSSFSQCPHPDLLATSCFPFLPLVYNPKTPISAMLCVLLMQ